jgi:hypothetical protein
MLMDDVTVSEPIVVVAKEVVPAKVFAPVKVWLEASLTSAALSERSDEDKPEMVAAVKFTAPPT